MADIYASSEIAWHITSKVEWSSTSSAFVYDNCVATYSSMSSPADLLGKIAQLLSDYPALTGSGETLSLRRPDRRVACGITMREGQLKVGLLFERDSTWAKRRVRELQEKDPNTIVALVAGTAQSGRVEDLPVAHRGKAERSEALGPGLSISHSRGVLGSLGCLVEVKPNRGGSWIGFISASHVLSVNNTAAKRDWVHHPGRGDIVPRLGTRVGTLEEFTELAHYASGATDVENALDVALVRIIDDDRVGANEVQIPDPADRRRKKTVRIRKPYPQDELADCIGQPVYKVGRTTGLTEGVLEYTNLRQLPIQMPDRRSYVFSEIALIASTMPAGGSGVGPTSKTVDLTDPDARIIKKVDPFSLPGDSGSLVFTRDGRGIGLIIGASGPYTFVTCLDPCLREMDAELL